MEICRKESSPQPGLKPPGHESDMLTTEPPRQDVIYNQEIQSPEKEISTLSQMTNFRLFQTQRFADDNFRFDENRRKFTK